MELQWKVYLEQLGTENKVDVCAVRRPVDGAKIADFGLSLSEGRQILAAIQQLVAQDQIRAYDALRRNCRHCGKYRRIKDWRTRTFATALGKTQVKVPRVISCMCTPEPLDDNDDSADLRFSQCSVEPILPTRRTPEAGYLCAKHGSSLSYREAARNSSNLPGYRSCHTNETVGCGQYVENEQFRTGWLAGRRKHDGAKRLRISIDGTVLTSVPLEEAREFEVVAGRVECDDKVARRFVSALQLPSLTRVLVAGALDQCGWAPSTMVDVVTDGTREMRSLVTSVAPCVTSRILDWFHISMKMRAIKSALCARELFRDRPEITRRSERLLMRVRDALWRGRGQTAIEMLRTLAASLTMAVSLPLFYGISASTACRAAIRLLSFLENNRRDLVDYQRARMNGRRISSASAESVMNHLINRRLSKRQQMRWSMKGAHYLHQTRVELLDVA